MKEWAATALVWLEQLASRPLGAVLLFVAGLAVFAVRAVAWPLQVGRDLDEYLLAYAQLFHTDPVAPWSMLFRTPLTPVVNGVLLDFAGGAFAEPAMAVLFAGSILAWAAAARTFGPRVAIATAVALLVYPAYGIMFHEVSSEPVFAAAFALWAYLVTRAGARPSGVAFALVGLGVAVLAFARPGNAVLVAFVLFPLVVRGAWREKLTWAAAFLAAAVLPLAAWSLHNGLRFGDYTLARGGNAVIPFYRAFIIDRIVSPENGPASRKLANAIDDHLLTREPYRSYGVTLDEVFTTGSFRIHEDLYLVSDQVFGWDIELLRPARRRHRGRQGAPGAYASAVLDTIWQQLSEPFFRVVSAPASSAGADAVSRTRSSSTADGCRSRPRASRSLAVRSSGSRDRTTASARCGRRRRRTSSPFDDPEDRARLENLERQVTGLIRELPDRDGNGQLGLRLNQLSRWYPRPVLWLLLGVIRHRTPQTSRVAHAGRTLPRGAPRRRVQRPRPAGGPPLRLARPACVRAARRRRSSGRARRGTLELTAVSAAIMGGPMQDEPRISVVVPCLNEEEAVGDVIDAAWEGIRRSGHSGEVIVVDNGSTDRSAAIAIEHGATVIREDRRGYGSAYLAGLASARGEYVVMGDADGTYPLGELGPFVDAPRERRRPRARLALRGHDPQGRCRGATAASETLCSPACSTSSSAPGCPTPIAACARSSGALPTLDLHSTGHGVRVGDGLQGVPPQVSR